MPNFPTHIHSLYTSPMLAWMLFALLLCGVLLTVYRPYLWKDGLSACFSRVDRRYAAPVGIGAVVVTIVFIIGSLAVALWTSFYQDGEPVWTALAMVGGWVCLWQLLHRWVLLLLGYIFSLPKEAQAVQDDTVLLLLLCSLVVFCLCCLTQMIPMQTFFRGALAVTAAAYLLCVLVKLCITFLRSFKTLLYIVLYVMTAEVLPLVLVYEMSRRAFL